MKKGMIPILAIVVFISMAAAAQTCNIVPILLNQDPYPATQGEYVKLVFQLQGMENTDCGKVTFELQNKYPLIFDPNSTTRYEIDSGTFKTDYNSSPILSYKVRVDKDAVDGDNPIQVQYSFRDGQVDLLKQFNLNIGNSQADFEVFVKDYNYATKALTLEVLNYGKSKVQAILVEIPKQENINLTGSNKNLAGDLDTNEYTSVDFTGSPIDGQMKVLISYTDVAGIRRSMAKQVSFDSSYFLNTKPSSGGFSWTTLIIIVIVLAIIYYFYRRSKKKRSVK